MDDRENLYTNYFRNMKIEQLMKEYDYLENDIYVNSNIEEKPSKRYSNNSISVII